MRKEKTTRAKIEEALSFALAPNEGIIVLLSQANIAHEEALFTEEQKYVFITRVAVQFDQMRNFVVLHDRKTPSRIA